ncbi:MAG: hypothetical protein D6788_10845, partial [Planctomycetota bacterium]
MDDASMSPDEEREPQHPPTEPIGDGPDGGAPDVPPMTFSLLGRFFAVPLLIIAVIVGGAVTVVLLFGGPAAPQDRSIDELLHALETETGERSLGVLLPKEKELWQAALELSVRLQKKESEPELTPEKLKEVTERLAGMVRDGLADLERLPPVEETLAQQRQMRASRLAFLIRALGWTDRAEAVPVLTDVLKSGRDSLVLAALQSLGRLHKVSAARESCGRVVSVMEASGSPEVKLVAATVLSVLAEPGSPEVIEALKRVRLSAEGEVAWSASLALARLGSDAGKSTLLDLLDRSFLESGERYHVTDERGVTHRYPM